MADARLQHQYSVVVDGRRDHYQVPIAIHEAGALCAVISDFYTPDWLMTLTPRVSARMAARLSLRHTAALPSRYFVTLFPQHQVGRYVMTVRGRSLDSIYRYQENLLSKRAARYVRQHPDTGVVCYSYYWQALAQERRAGIWTGPAIVFQVHPIATQIRKILEADRAKTGLTYSPEREEIQPISEVEDYLVSLEQANGIFAASRFTARGLTEAGVNPDGLYVAPYGTGLPGDENTPLELNSERWRHQRPLRLLWVGQLAYRKAAHHLFAALNRFSPEDVSLSLVTRSAVPPELAKLMPPNVRVFHNVGDAEREQMYLSHHLFILPSLVEGFGLVYQEALARALPVLCTTNTGGADVINDEVEGFVVRPGVAADIEERIRRCLEATDLLPAMSSRAIAKANLYSWPRFRSALQEGLTYFESAGRQESQ